MTNYRRLISYIYTYESEVKGRNIGSAKLEPRNGQCKLSVNVKKVYVGGSDPGVYLLALGKEVFLGGISTRNGSGEFRAMVNVENAADSDCSMDQCYGLTIHEQGDTWRAYTTIWEDAVVRAAEAEPASVASSRVGGAGARIYRKVEELNQELRPGEKTAESGGGSVLSSSPVEARQMSAGRGATENTKTLESAKVVRGTEILAQTSEEAYQTENETNQMAGTLDQATEEAVGAEEILPRSMEADTVEMSQKQENQDDRNDLALEPELLPGNKDGMESKPGSLTDGMLDEMSDEIEEMQELGGIPDSQLESQSENTAELEITVELGKTAEEHKAGFQNNGPAGITPRRDMEQMDGMIALNMGREQEMGHRVWSGNRDFGEQPNSEYGRDKKDATSIGRQLYEENESVPREFQIAHDPLNMGPPRQGGMVPDTRISLQPDNMPEDRTISGPNTMTRPGVPRRHMFAGTVYAGSSGGQSDQEQMMDRCLLNQRPISRQQPMPGQQPVPGQQRVPCQQPTSNQQSRMLRQLTPSNQTMPSRQQTPGQSPLGQHPVTNRQPVSSQQAIQNQQPISNQQPVPNQQPISSQRSVPNQQPMPGWRPTSSQQSMPGQQPIPNQQPISNHRPTSNQQPMPNRQPMPNHRPVPSQRLMPNQQPIPNQQPTPGQQPMSDRQPLPNQRPGSRIRNRGRQMRSAGPEAGDNNETAGQTRERVPVIDAGEEALILGNPQGLERLEQEEQRFGPPDRL